MHAIDFFGLGAAVVIALLAQIVQPWSRAWWVGMSVAGLVALSALGNIAWNSWPSPSKLSELPSKPTISEIPPSKTIGVKKYQPDVAVQLINALHDDDDQVAILDGVLQPAMNVFNPRLWEQNLELRDSPQSHGPQELFISRLLDLAWSLDEIQDSIRSTHIKIGNIQTSLSAPLAGC